MIALFKYIINQIFTPSVLNCAFKVWNVCNDNFMKTSCIVNNTAWKSNYRCDCKYDYSKWRKAYFLISVKSRRSVHLSMCVVKNNLFFSCIYFSLQNLNYHDSNILLSCLVWFWGFTPLSTVFQSYHGSQYTYPCVLGTVFLHQYHTQLSFQATNCLLSHWQSFHSCWLAN